LSSVDAGRLLREGHVPLVLGEPVSRRPSGGFTFDRLHLPRDIVPIAATWA